MVQSRVLPGAVWAATILCGAAAAAGYHAWRHHSPSDETESPGSSKGAAARPGPKVCLAEALLAGKFCVTAGMASRAVSGGQTFAYSQLRVEKVYCK